MTLLLDTHTIAWWSEGGSDLPTKVREAIGDPDNIVFVSAVSSYELALKYRLGKWPAAEFLAANLEALIEQQGFMPLPLTFAHARTAGELPPVHRDPFDRMLAAQAMVENLTLVSIDAQLDLFGVRRLW